MEEKRKQDLLELIGFIFLGIYIYILIIFISTNYVEGLLWMCYLGIPLMALGIFLKKPDIILSQIFILLIPDLLWSIDFFYRIFFGNTLLGIDNFFFTTPYLSRKILSLQHSITPLLGLTTLALLKPKKFSKALIISFFEILLVFLVNILFKFKEEINCLPTYKSCMFSDPSFLIPYPIFWIILESIFILISFLFIKFVYLKNNFFK